MPKFLLRIVTLLLVPCLIADPGLATTYSLREHFPTIQIQLQTHFQEQALALVSSSDRQNLQWWPSLRPVRHLFVAMILTAAAGQMIGQPKVQNPTAQGQPPISVATSRVGATSPQAAQAEKSRLPSYFATLKDLSTGDWIHAGRPYYGTNEFHHERFFQAIRGKSGAMLGVSFQQNFNFALHGQASVYVILDINPVVTEVLVPYIGRLMEMSETRQEFMSQLIGVELSNSQVEQLMQPNLSAWRWYRLMDELIDRQTVGHGDAAQRMFEAEILPHLSITPEQRRIAIQYLRDLVTVPPPDPFRDTGAGLIVFLRDQVREDDDELRPNALATWLSNEENYQSIRALWLKGGIVGVTGDIRDFRGASRIGKWLRERGETVSAIYISNLRAREVIGTGDGLDRMYRALDQLPLRSDALLLDAADLYAHVIPYSIARKSRNNQIDPIYLALVCFW